MSKRSEEREREAQAHFEASVAILLNEIRLDEVAQQIALGDGQIIASQSRNDYLRAISLASLSMARDMRRIADRLDPKES